jgi:hypothetical protein
MRGSTIIEDLSRFLQLQNKENKVSLYFFNQSVEKVIARLPVRNINFTKVEEAYVPCGSTALFDAIDEVVTDINTFEPIVVIYTDGIDTSSRKYSYEYVKESILELQMNGWMFVFMGSSPESYQGAALMGIPKSMTHDGCFDNLVKYFRCS